MSECSICGWCETPGACVWSVECPRCSAIAGAQCIGAGGRAEGLHLERHAAAAAAPPLGGGATGISRADWEELKRIEEFLDEEPHRYDMRTVDSLLALEGGITAR